MAFGSDVAQPATEVFATTIAGGPPVAPAPALATALIPASPANDFTLPKTAIASLLALASVDQAPMVAAETPTKPEPVAPQKEPQPDILVVQLGPATDPETPPVGQPIVRAAPDIPTECPAAPDAPTATPAPDPVKDRVLPPVSPGRRRPEAPPIISVLQPVTQSPDPVDTIDAPATEPAKKENPETRDAPIDKLAPQPTPPLPATSIAPPVIISAATIAATIPPAVIQPATPTVQPPSEAKPAPTAAPVSAAVKTSQPVATDRLAAPVAARDENPRPGNDQTQDQAPPASSTIASKPDDAAPAREPAPAFTPNPAPATATVSVPPQAAAKPPIATITAQPGRIGQELGVAIAHHVGSGATGGGETITLRLNPVDMGRIDVKLSFDDSGTLRAVVSADNPAALDMLRRDSADLGRALSDAGVRADTQTLRFDTRGDGQRGGQASDTNHPSHRQPQPRDTRMIDAGPDTQNDIAAAYRPLRTRGRVDMVA